MEKIAILGSGLVGKPIALDLAKNGEFDVTVADIDEKRLAEVGKTGIGTFNIDLKNKKETLKFLSAFDMVVNAVPGFMGFDVLKTCLEAGKDTVDIAFYPENPFDLDGLAKNNRVRVICDMGVAPGMSNLLAGYAASKMQKVNSVKIYVGGLPKVRTLPWEYKAVFSPSDVIEEYTRTARLVENGKIVEKEPLTEIELLDFDKTGTLEAFNSDGLRSLMFTLKADNMVEKTLRYPGYASKIKLLAQNGFFGKEKINVNGKWVAPLEMTSQLLFDKWKLKENEIDITVMRIVVQGVKDGENVKYEFNLYDEYDPLTGIHSMARTTGYSATMAVRLLAGGLYNKTGITMPEILGKDENTVDFMLSGLSDRGVEYKMKVSAG